jgi:hypothetical protein
MRERALACVALIATVSALGVAGCGGDDETSTTPTTGASGASGASGPLTAGEWTTQADDICAQGDKDQRAAIEQFIKEQGISGQPSSAELEQLASEVIIPNIEQQINAIKALPAPEDQAEQITAFVDQAETDLNGLKDDPGQITEGNANPFAETRTLAQDLGLKNCASDN